MPFVCSRKDKAAVDDSGYILGQKKDLTSYGAWKILSGKYCLRSFCHGKG